MSDDDIDEKFKKLLMKKGMVSNELYWIHQSNIDIYHWSTISLFQLLSI